MAHAIGATVKAVTTVAPSIGSVGTMTSTAVDCAGFERCLYTLNLGVATTNGVIDMKVQDCDTVGGSYSDVSPAAALTQVTKAAGDSTVQMIDVKVNPARPFQKVVAVVGTAAFPNSVTALLYAGSGARPATPKANHQVVIQA